MTCSLIRNIGLEASLCDIMSSGVLNAWNDCTTNKHKSTLGRFLRDSSLSVHTATLAENTCCHKHKTIRQPGFVQQNKSTEKSK